LTRYVGWLEQHKTNGRLTKGIIIAAQYDNRLHYALTEDIVERLSPPSLCDAGNPFPPQAWASRLP